MVIDYIKKYRNNPLLWVKEIIADTPRGWQQEILEIYPLTKYIAIKSGQGVGKSRLVSWLTVWGLTTHYPIKILLTSVTNQQLHNALWSEVKLVFQKLPAFIKKSYHVTNERISLVSSPESFAATITPAKDRLAAFQGVHSSNVFIFIDEASGIIPEAFEYIMGSMTNPNSKLMLTGNPNYTSGYFYDIFAKPLEIFTRKTVSKFDIIKDLPPHEAQSHMKFIEDMETMYGKDSPPYKIRVLGEFSENQTFQIFSPKTISKATQNIPQKSTPIVWGIDVARYGADASVVCMRNGDNVQFYHYRNLSTTDLASTIYGLWLQTKQKPTAIVIDEIGVGSGVVDYLKKTTNLPIIGINISTKSSNERFYSLKEELLWRVRDEIEYGNLHISVDSLQYIDEEMRAINVYEINGKIKAVSKEEMRKKIGRSTDYLDSLSLTMYDQIQAINTFEFFTQEIKWQTHPII